MKKLVFVIIMFLGLFFAAPHATFAQTDAEYSKALKYYNTKKYAKAVEQLQDYVKKTPNPAAYYLMGYSLYKLGKFDEATQYFNEAYLLDPDFSLEKAGLIQKQPEDKTKEKSAQQADEHEQKPSAEAKAKQPEAKKEAAPSKQPSAKPEPVPAKQPDVKQPSKAIQPQKPGLQKVTPEKKAPVTEQKTEAQEVKPPAGMPPTPMPAPAMPKAAPGLFAGLLAGFALFFILFAVVYIIYYLFCIYRIAQKLNLDRPWLAWIPIANLCILTSAAGKPWWWILLMLIPIVGPVIYIYLWILITENCGKNKWLGILMIVPIADLVWLSVLAFSKSDASPSPAPVSEEPPAEEPPSEEQF